MTSFEMHEKLQTISRVAGKAIHEYVDDGGAADDVIAECIASGTIDTIMPELRGLVHTRIALEASHAFSIRQPEKPVPLEDVRLYAHLGAVSIRTIISTWESSNSHLTVEDFDLHLVLVPRYIQPEPDTIAKGYELYVPLNGIEFFEPAE